MNRLTELALAYASRDRPLRVLDAAAGDGQTLVALADAFWSEPRHASLADATRAEAVLERLRGADRTDRGASRAIASWAGSHGAVATDIVSTGEPLAFEREPVQGSLFQPTVVPRPPAAFAAAPFDVVIADVPRRDLDPSERDRLRLRFEAVMGHFSGEVPFVERMLDLARPDGLVVLRMRAAILRREFGRALVDALGQRASLLAVERDGAHVIVVLRLCRPGDGAALLRTFGSENAARTLRAIGGGRHDTLADWLRGAPGSTSTPGCDDVWEAPTWLEGAVPTMPIVRGADISSWSVRGAARVVWPYDEHGARRTPPDPAVVGWLSRFRPLLESRELFGRSLTERDVRWYEYLEHHPDRWGRGPAVVIARTGNDPRVAILREPAVVSGSAMLLVPSRPEDAPFIAGVLGSSLAAFWYKHTFHVYETDAGQMFEATAVGLGQFPMPPSSDEVGSIASALDRVARSRKSLYWAIDGEPERLESRLRGVHEANERVLSEHVRLQADLDAAVLRAYGLDDDVGVRELLDSADYTREWSVPDAADEERDALIRWLVHRITDGFATHELASDRPVAADEVADWLRRQPLARAVLARAELSTADVLMWGAVAWEPSATFSPRGLEKLQAWARGDCRPFHLHDYAARASRVPPMPASRQRRRAWRWRGRYNVPREPFIHLVELSEARNRAYFAWSGADEAARRRLTDFAADEAVAQVDLERLLQLQRELAGGDATTAELADRLFTRGWSHRDVQLALEVLGRNGAVIERGHRWRLKR